MILVSNLVLVIVVTGLRKCFRVATLFGQWVELAFKKRAYESTAAVMSYYAAKEPPVLPDEIILNDTQVKEGSINLPITSNVLTQVLHRTSERDPCETPRAGNLCTTLFAAYGWELSNIVPLNSEIRTMMDSGTGWRDVPIN